ncbi:hypothetical protein BH10BAC2_BH10BAC2_13740 [soil metagenome]
MLGICFCAKADHITGGEIYYTLKSVAGNQYTYSVTVKMYMDCASIREFNNPAIVSIFDRAGYTRIKDINVALSATELLQKTDNDPCITNPQQVCYRVGYYNFDITLPASASGYTIAVQVFFRVNNLQNLTPNYNNVGATYTAEIPGNATLPAAPDNNSATFLSNDLAIICGDNDFNYSFAATDKDGDRLQYSLCNAYQSNSSNFGTDARPPDAPPYRALPYAEPYDGIRPLGYNVTINSNTGLMSGVAPPPGTYAIAVCIEEIRNGVVIAQQRKDLQIKVTSCSKASATLPSEYILCGDTQSILLENQSISPLIESYYWQISDQAANTLYTSTEPLIDYTFTDTGLYTIKLLIGVGNQCADTAISYAKVYPGFTAGFTVDGICINKQSHFIDATKSTFGIVNSWLWDFNTADFLDENATAQNPFYTYTTEGTRNAQLIVSDSKGCRDTVLKVVTVFEKPPVQLAFRDTLICLPDTLQLHAQGSGNFVWTSAAGVVNANTSSPSVAPQTTTTYYVNMDQGGCINSDSVVVRVVDHVTLQAMNDTTICRSDTVQLHIISDGLKYTWSPAATLNDNTLQNPLAAPLSETITYNVCAVIGNCMAKENIKVSTEPYPFAFTGNDSTICYGATVQLTAITDGSIFSWSPAGSLNNPGILNPLATPAITTTYIFSAFDNEGCPKPAIDTIKIVVLSKVPAFAGRDTSVVINQPLQLNGSGGTTYNWSPPAGLSSVNIPNPVALYSLPGEGIRYRLMVSIENGCADSSFITVKVYKTLPSVFVPTGFTPNGDGKNDILRPIITGIQRVELFNIYNRWGQLIFTTSENGKGWNGSINGMPQQAGTYVWMVKAIDYNGAPYFQKGTVTIVR